MSDIVLSPVTEVDAGDILKNGHEVIDGWINDSGEYQLIIERVMIDGSTDRYPVQYPLTAFLRVRRF